MEWIRNWLAQIQAQLSGLNQSSKWLIACLLVIAAMSLLFVALLTGRTDMAVLVQGASAEQFNQITQYLDARGIEYQVRGDQLLVPEDQKISVAAAMQTQSLLPESGQGFAELIERQTWWQSSDQNQQAYRVALMNELSRTIARWPDVARANVIIDFPREQGFDATVKSPTASVNLHMGRGSLNQKVADSIAGLVSGAVAEMAPEDVVVIDAEAGRHFRARGQQEIYATDMMEMMQTQEKLYHDKIASALSYIPNVIVAVNVEVDPTRRQVQSTKYSREDSVELITRESSRTESTREAGSGGEPGARPNVGADIAGANAAGRSSSVEEAEAEFDPFAGRINEHLVDPGGVTQVSATVNVPRSFFVSLYMQGREQDAEPPDDAALQPTISSHLARIREQIQPLISAKEQGVVVVDVYPDGSPAMATAMAGPGGGGGVIGQMLSGGIIRFAGLAALAAASLLTMFLMLRKAAQQPKTPTAEEIAGLPPALDVPDELVGEAGEADSALPGMELDEDQMASRQVSKQVADMVKSNPDEATTLLRQWIKQSS